MFSNAQADTVEHVIPKWLQRKFNLQEQSYHLPNGTTLKYKNAVAPASSEENAQFGKIEEKIANGSASHDEIYLWALKIHVGLIYISSNLKFDIRDPKSPKFWDANDFSKDIWLFRQLYKIWKNGGRTTPSPFGTVFKMKSLLPEDQFDLVHNLQSRTLLIKIGGEIIFVCFFDKGFLAKKNFNAKLEEHRSRIGPKTENNQNYELECFTTQRVWACEASYVNYRLPKKFSFTITNNSFISPISSLVRLREENKNELESFCRSFGLILVQYNKNAANTYANITTDEYNDMVRENMSTYISWKNT